MTEYTKGTKAFIDSFGGLIRCVITEVNKPSNGRRIGPLDELTVTVEETKGGYRRGEVLKRNAAYTPPRCHVRTTSVGTRRINNLYQYV